MSEKHPGPLVVEGKLSDAERMKDREQLPARHHRGRFK